MSQQSKVIDVNQTFFPTDPNAFPENLLATEGEDSPFKAAPVLAFEGYNFLPTVYGYKSFFGMNGDLGIDALASRCDELLIYQKQTFENFLVALCEDGIWIKDGAVAGAWTHAIILDIPPVGTHREWTWCIIEDELFMYRQAELFYYRISTHAIFSLPLVSVDDVIVAISATVGGTIPAGNYSYSVACKIGGVWSPPSISYGVALLNSTSIVTISWSDEATATDYRIYQTDLLTGITQYWEVADPTLTYVDSGTAGTVVVLPDPASVATAPYAPYAQTPSGLNMVGQIGLFKAGIRLGFWDSEDSVSYSSPDDYTDFVTSLATLANSGQKFNDVIGRIVVIRQFGTGFIIYATKSIVLITRNTEGVFLWQSKAITNNVGIAYMHECCLGSEDTMHFAWSSKGLLKIEEGSLETIAVGATDFLKETRDPLYLKMLQNRHLFLELINPLYINGAVSFRTSIVSAVLFDFEDAYNFIQEPDTSGCQVYNIITKIPDQVSVYGANPLTWATLPKTSSGYPVGVYVPVMTGHTGFYWNSTASLGSSSAANLRIFAEHGLELIPDLSFLDNLDTTDGLIPSITFPYGSQDMSSMIANPDQTLRENYAGSLESFFPDQFHLWHGATRLFKAYIEKFLTMNSGEHVSGTLSGLMDGSSIADFQTFLDGLNDLSNVTALSFFGLFPIELGPERFEAQTVSGFPYAIISTYYPFKRLAYLYGRKHYRRLSSTPDGGGGFNHTYDATLTFGVVYVDIEPCIKITIQSADPGLRAIINTATHLHHLYGWVSMIRATARRMYALDGSYVDSAFVPPSLDNGFPSGCPTPTYPTFFGLRINGFNETDGTICGNPAPGGPVYEAVPGVALPASSFLLQSGSPAPIYPTFEGALTYDIQLKKWGKFKGQHKQLLDFSPINHSGTGLIPYDVFGVDAGCLAPTGFIFVFDQNPSDSWIKYGKIGYSRQGFTDAESVIARFRAPFTGDIAIEGSLDGRTIETSLDAATAFAAALVAETFYTKSARWYNIKISGTYDLNYLEFRGTKASRR